MGTGAKIVEMKENFKKIWVLGNWNVFGEGFNKHKVKLLSMIKAYFERRKNSFFSTDYSDLIEIEQYLNQIRESEQLDITTIVDMATIEREENGGAHKVRIQGSKYVFPDP